MIHLIDANKLFIIIMDMSLQRIDFIIFRKKFIIKLFIRINNTLKTKRNILIFLKQNYEKF